MLQHLSFDNIALFVRVAQLGTLSSVARQRNVPVSQVSRALQRIEQAFGAHLVHRSIHGLALTPEGEALLVDVARDGIDIASAPPARRPTPRWRGRWASWPGRCTPRRATWPNTACATRPRPFTSTGW